MTDIDTLLADVADLARHHDAEGPGSERYTGLDARIREAFEAERARADRAEAALRAIRDEIARGEEQPCADNYWTTRSRPTNIQAWIIDAQHGPSWYATALAWLKATVAAGLGEEAKG